MSDWTELQVFCADIGSIAGANFGWARRDLGTEEQEEHSQASIESLAIAVSSELKRVRPVALGFEMPLFVPVPEDSQQLGRARPCDVNAPAWSSGIGASVMATGLAQVPWLLRAIRETAPGHKVYLRWEEFAQAEEGLLIWEAFVTRDAKGADHVDDARIGVEAFCAQLPSVGDANADETERPFSLAAAAALWAGWDLSLNELRRACVLVRA